MSVSSVDDAKRASLALLDKGCRTAIITLGKDGAVYATAEERSPVHVPVQSVNAVDTTVSINVNKFHDTTEISKVISSRTGNSCLCPTCTVPSVVNDKIAVMS